MTKENIYDERISPLVHQIIDICKEHNIALLLSAQLEDEHGDRLYCTTILPGDDDTSDEKFIQALNIIRPPRRSMHITTTHADGSQTLTAII
ncbi:hypothetical protein ACIPIN_14140 [Pseudomonas sp. NPDC087697]|uniref:hypothetical protein n=1 Tax=Pseudomonas sp. NPDC087697 TaxID=3364447 RepID=UPI00381352D0